jgi:hypothetical protein
MPNGACNGFVVHRYEQKRMFRLHDTPWTQAAMIRGYYNLASRSGETRWRDAALLAADLQARRLDERTGKYVYAGHENDRFCSLIHCALANCSLLTVLPLLDEARRTRYVDVVRTNTDRYILDKLWVEEEGAFRFSEIDYYSRDEDRFVMNFNTMAAENLLGLAEITGEQRYRDVAHRVGQWLIGKWTGHRRREAEAAHDAPIDGLAVPPGGMAYQYSVSRAEPDNCVAIYAGLALRGVRALYEATGDERFAEMLRGVSDWLLRMRDPATHLFYHTTNGPRIEPHPQFIAGAGMTLLGLLDARAVSDDRVVPEDTIAAILDRTYDNGSVPGFIGKHRHRPGGTGEVVWEDVAASVNWNAQWFEYLTRLVEDPSAVRVVAPSSVCVAGDGFRYRDGRRSVSIVSWRPAASACLYWAWKRLPLAPVCIRWPTIKSLAGRILRRCGRRHV